MLWWIAGGIAGVMVAAVVVYMIVVCVRVRMLERAHDRTWSRIQEQLTRRESAVREIVALAKAETGLAWEAVQSALECARACHETALEAARVQEELLDRTTELLRAMSAPEDPGAALKMEHALKVLVRAEDRIAQFRKIFNKAVVWPNNALLEGAPAGSVARLFGCRRRDSFHANDRVMSEAFKEFVGRCMLETRD